MCLRGPPPPVLLDGGGPGTLFLDNLFGWTLADRLRAFAGYRPLHDVNGPFGIMCGDPDSYLSCCFSSLWSLGVVLLSFAAGMIFSSRRKTGWAILGAGAAVSLLDMGIRLAVRFGRAPAEYRDWMIAGLPGQLATNLVFQMVLPFAAALLLDRLGRAVRWSLARAF